MPCQRHMYNPLDLPRAHTPSSTTPPKPEDVAPSFSFSKDVLFLADSWRLRSDTQNLGDACRRTYARGDATSFSIHTAGLVEITIVAL